MRIKQRALWGYTLSSVESTIREIQNQYADRLKKIEGEIAELSQQNDQLLDEITRLKEESPK